MKALFTLLLSSITLLTAAQEVTKTVLVEHFTNTYCSVCASRNPGFYTNLDNHPDVLHVAYHPSSPYNACPLSQHNVSENDARTMYYGIFGGTPRLVVQGEVVPAGNDYSSPAVFDPHENQTTAFDMSTSVTQNATLDSIITTVLITKTANSAIDSLNIHTVLVEETLNFNANNGETVHHDVFRKSMNGEDPVKIELPANVGDDTTITYVAEINSAWNGNEIKSVTLLQNDQRQIEQANESEKLNYTASLPEEIGNEVIIYPNPLSNGNSLTFSITNDVIKDISVTDIQGRMVFREKVKDQQTAQIKPTKLTPGIYKISIGTSNGFIIKKITVR